MKNKRIHAGFTLAEILLTVALLGIVLSVAGAALWPCVKPIQR